MCKRQSVTTPSQYTGWMRGQVSRALINDIVHQRYAYKMVFALMSACEAVGMRGRPGRPNSQGNVHKTRCDLLQVSVQARCARGRPGRPRDDIVHQRYTYKMVCALMSACEAVDMRGRPGRPNSEGNVDKTRCDLLQVSVQARCARGRPGRPRDDIVHQRYTYKMVCSLMSVCEAVGMRGHPGRPNSEGNVHKTRCD